MQEILLPLSTITFQVPDGSSLSQETQTNATEGTAEGGTTDENTSSGGGFMGQLPFLLLIGAFFWFVMIAPERKRRKKHTAMMAQLSKGDEVVTTSGMYGKIVQIQDQIVTLQVADGVRMRFSLNAVQGITSGDGTVEPAAAKPG